MRTSVRRLAAAVTLSCLVAATFGLGTTAGASGGSDPVLADGLFGPLSIDVGPRGAVVVSQQNLDFDSPDVVNTVTRVSRFGKVTDLFSEPGAAAVAIWRKGTYYTVVPDETTSLLRFRSRHGHTRTVADLYAYEVAHNPDAASTYGIVDPSTDCEEQWLASQEAFELPPINYTGIIESNPYAIATTKYGTYVADAAGNAILFVTHSGRVRTVSVLPPQPLEIPAELAEGIGAPACAGHVYNFEPVPTDVEVHGKKLYVSLLPGGPEDPSLGARGAVYEISRSDGSARRIADGFLAATDLAVAPDGTVYVAELFGGQITKVTRTGATSVVLSVPAPAAVEWARGKLHVAYDVFGPDAKVGRFSG